MSKPADINVIDNPFISENPPTDVEPDAALATALGRTPEETTPPVEEETPPVEEETPSQQTDDTTQQQPDDATQQQTTDKQRQPSRKDLSTQLEAATTELEKLRSEGAVYDQKYKDAVAKQGELEAKLAERDKEYTQARTPKYRWEDDPEVAKPRTEIMERYNDLVADVTPESAKLIQGDFMHIVNAYGEARTKGPEALRQVKEKVTERYGEDTSNIWRTVQEVFPKHAAALEAQKRNGETHFERTVTDYQTRAREVRAEFAAIGRATPDQIAAAPDDINSIISAAIAGDEKLIKEVEVLAAKAAQATAGLPPLPADAAPEVVEQYRVAERNMNEFRQKQAFRRDVEAKVLTAIVRKQAAELEALRKRVGTSAKANKPDVNAQSPAPAQRGNGVEVPRQGEYAEVTNPYTTR